MSGGGSKRIEDVLPRDAIRSVDDPTFSREYFGDPGDEVIAVEGDPAKAYPIRVLSYHEVVNDADASLAVTWCPICWSAAVYDPDLDGRSLTFGVSGKLADDALVLYDRETGSEWHQPSGECIAGDLLGRRLDGRPYAILTWEEFAAAYPGGVVLQPARGDTDGAARREYDMARYEAYLEREAFGLFGMRGEGERREWDREDIDAKTVVLGVEHGEEAMAYPLPQVEAKGGVVVDAVGDLDVVVVASDGRLYAYENPGLDFETRDGVPRADGTTWDPTTGESADGRHLERLPARQSFAFAWRDHHGDAFYTV